MNLCPVWWQSLSDYRSSSRISSWHSLLPSGISTVHLCCCLCWAASIRRCALRWPSIVEPLCLLQVSWRHKTSATRESSRRSPSSWFSLTSGLLGSARRVRTPRFGHFAKYGELSSNQIYSPYNLGIRFDGSHSSKEWTLPGNHKGG